MMTNLKDFLLAACLVLPVGTHAQEISAPAGPQKITMPLRRLADKVRGGWAGQTIGVSFGSYTEFRYNGTFIQDYQTIPWDEGQIKRLMDEWPGLFDDIYMDLTFVDVIERLGIDAPVDSFANAFAYAGYDLWHANQAARYNIMNGIPAPASGHWLNNPHADDIDYQIESDFAGLMNPGMPNAASHISDKVGHIINYGDGWYGGVFVGAMYSLAFIHDNIHKVVSGALQTVPEQADFHKCIADVIAWHRQYPDDWKQTWFEIQKKWTEEVGCPEGVFMPLNIDAKLNAAYIVLGLLYGNGDFTRTLEIATRAGQDSDCNPSSAAGILGTMHGYEQIPDYWKSGLSKIEDLPFKYTRMSLNKVYDISYKHALQMITRNGGTVADEYAIVQIQRPHPVRYEKSFEGLYPVERVGLQRPVEKELEFTFEGTGFALRGEARSTSADGADFVFTATCYLDGKDVGTVSLPTSFHARRHDLLWRYQLPKGRHTVRFVIQNPSVDHEVRAWDYVVYSDAPVDGAAVHVHKK